MGCVAADGWSRTLGLAPAFVYIRCWVDSSLTVDLDPLVADDLTTIKIREWKMIEINDKLCMMS